MIVVIGGGAAAEADRELNGGGWRRLDGRIHGRRRPRRRRKERFGVAFELGVVVMEEGFALMKQSDDTVIWIKGESTSCGHIFLMEPIEKKIWAKSLERANDSAINWEGLRLENKDQVGGGVG